MSLRTGACSLLRTSTRLLTTPKATISRSAVVFADIQVRDKLKEAKNIEVSKSGDKAVSGLITVEGTPDVMCTSGTELVTEFF